jgi:hypothetical protein
MRRWLVDDAAKRPRPKHFPTTIDVSPLSKKVDEVRNNPCSALRHDSKAPSRRAHLIATARALVADLEFFRQK